MNKKVNKARSAHQDQLCEEIQHEYQSLSKRLQQIARFILDNPQEVAFATVASFSKKADVHPSSLIRFANTFGFDGFSEMQKLFKNKLVEARPDYEQRIESVLSDVGHHSENASKQILLQLCDANNHALASLAQDIDVKSLESAKNILSDAGIIHIQAVRRAFPIGSYLAYLLGNMNMSVHLLDQVGGMQKQQQSLITANDAVVAISFYPYSLETNEMIDNAIEKGAKIVAFTDSPVSPVAQKADVCFCIQEAEIHSFRSLNSTMCLIQALALSLVKQNNN